MKKLVLIILSLMIVQHLFSQTHKGAWLLGGSIQFTSAKEKMYGNTISTSQIELDPSAGYFIIKNLAVGLHVGLSSVTNKDNGPNETATLFAAGPFARYYIDAGGNVKIVTAATFGIGSTKGIIDYSKHTVTSYRVEGGPAIFVNPAVAIEFLSSYQGSKFNSKDNFYDATNNVVGVGLGLQVYLNKKAK